MCLQYVCSYVTCIDCIFSMSLYPSNIAYQSILLNNSVIKHRFNVKICNSSHELSQRVNCFINTLKNVSLLYQLF